MSMKKRTQKSDPKLSKRGSAGLFKFAFFSFCLILVVAKATAVQAESITAKRLGKCVYQHLKDVISFPIRVRLMHQEGIAARLKPLLNSIEEDRPRLGESTQSYKNGEIASTDSALKPSQPISSTPTYAYRDPRKADSPENLLTAALSIKRQNTLSTLPSDTIASLQRLAQLPDAQRLLEPHVLDGVLKKLQATMPDEYVDNLAADRNTMDQISNPASKVIDIGGDWTERSFDVYLRAFLKHRNYAERYVVIRFFKKDRLPLALASGTDRDLHSEVWDFEEDIDHTGDKAPVDPSKITYARLVDLSKIPLETVDAHWRDLGFLNSMDSSEDFLIYKASGLKRKSTNEFEFVEDPKRSLLGIFSVTGTEDGY
jgi:hypothetical protein